MFLTASEIFASLTVSVDEKFSTFMVPTVKSVGKGVGRGVEEKFEGAMAPIPAAFVRML
jgi:hypothetical protein